MPHLRPLFSLCSLLIRFISDPTAPSWFGFMVAALMFLFSVTQTLILHHYYHLVVVIGLKLRTAVLGVIYRKVSCQQGCSREGAHSPRSP